jgi:hypothetical protein
MIEKTVAIPEMRRRLNFLATKRGLQELLDIIASSHASSQRGFQDLLLLSSSFRDIVNAGTHGGEAAPIIDGRSPMRGGHSDCRAPRYDLEAANGRPPQPMWLPSSST